MNNPNEEATQQIADLKVRVDRLEATAIQRFNRDNEIEHRIYRALEQVRQLQELNREIQRQLDRLYRVGLEAAPRTSFDDLQEWIDTGCQKPDMPGCVFDSKTDDT